MFHFTVVGVEKFCLIYEIYKYKMSAGLRAIHDPDGKLSSIREVLTASRHETQRSKPARHDSWTSKIASDKSEDTVDMGQVIGKKT